MKNLNFLSTIGGTAMGLQSSDTGYRCRVVTDSLPSFCRVKMLRFISIFVLILTIGVGNVWGDTYTLGWGTASGTTGTYSNFTAISGSVTNLVSFSSDKNSSSNTPAYNSSSSELRLYYASNGSGGSVTLTPATGVTITGFVMTTSTSPSVKYSVNGGSATSVSVNTNTYTVTGISASTSLKIQNVNTTNTQLRIKTIAITYTVASSKTLSSISVSTAPTKKKYVAGETFDPTGLVIRRNYSDDTNDTYAYAGHTSDFTFSPTTLTALTTSNTSVSITYGGKSTSQAINVYNVTMQARDEDGNTIPSGGPGAPSCTGKSITPAADANNYVFKQWQVTNASLGSGESTKSNTITNPTGAVTVTAVYHKPITITYKANGQDFTTQTYGYGGTLAFPASEPDGATYSCTGKTFTGWVAEANKDYSHASTAPTYATAGGSVTEAATYYAVFATADEGESVEGWQQCATLDDFVDGDFYLFVSPEYNNTHYYVPAPSSAVSQEMYSSTADGNQVASNSNPTSITKAQGAWKLIKSSTSWKIQSSNASTIYLYTGTNNNKLGAAAAATASGTWTITKHTSSSTFAFQYNSSRYLCAYNASPYGFRTYTGTSTNGTAYLTVYHWISNSGTTYSNYVTSCCTTLDAVSNVSVVPGRTSATVSWDKLTNASGYEYKLGDAEWATASVADANNPSISLSTLSGATSYAIQIRATGDGTTYCAEGTASAVTNFKTLSRVTAAVNDGARGAAKVSLTSGSGWADYVDAADGTTIYLQATPSSASWTLGSWDASNGTVASNQLTDWTGDVTVTANFAAAELPTLATPTGMSNSAVTATSATISWNAVANASSYAVSCTPSATQSDITENDGVYSCTLTGLTAGTAYTWNVQAIGDNISYKSGAACDDQNFTTEAKKPTLVEITTNPTKTTYNSGEKFNAEGLVVKVTYNNGDIDAAYTGYTLSPTTDDVLTPANNKVTVSATLNDVTASADVAIVVNAKLTWKAAGAEDVYTYASSGKVVLPENNPSAPDCLGEFDTFQGWGAAIATSVNVEPSYVTAETDATADATYYAVFARMENGGTEDASSTFTVKTASAPGSPYLAEDGATWTYNTSDGLNFENGANAGFVKSKSGWIQVELPSSATEAVSFVVTKTSNTWSGDAAASLTSGSTNIATINNAGDRSYTFTNSNKGLGTYKLTNVSSTTKACYIDYITINYKKVGKVPAEWATTCCTSWDAPAISYDVPSGWKNGDDALAVAIASGATHGDVSYASSNTDVLTVAANGTITAVGPGTAKVTATWAGGLDNEVKYCEALSESATITVTGTVTIHFDGNGATSGSMSDQVVTYNVAEALTANAFEKTGYTFYGWADTQEKANAGTRDYTNQESVAFLANTTLYAVWTINSHAVTLTQPTGNTIEATGAADLASVAYGTEITLTAEENDGYVFTGWSVTGATVVDANAKSTTFTMPDNDVAVSANYSTYEWISTGYSVTTHPKTTYTKVEKFSTAGVVIKQNFKRSDDESLTKQEDYEGVWTAKLNGEAIADGADLSLGDDGKTLILYIGKEEIASYTLTVSDIATDQFIDGLWGETFDSQIETYTMPTPSAHDAGSVAECKDHNIFVGWVEEANVEDPKDENIIAGGQTGMTASNKTYYAVWAKEVEQDLPAGYRMITSAPIANDSVILAIKNGIKYYAMQNSGKGVSSEITLTSGVVTNPNGYGFKVLSVSGGLQFQAGSNYIHFNSSEINVTTSTTNATATLTANNGAFTIYGNSRYLMHNGTKFTTTASSESASAIYIFKKQAASKQNVYTDYITECAQRYQISYDANGGEGSSYESVEKKEGATIELPDGSELEKQWHTFIGWKVNNEGELLTTTYTVGDANVTLYAQWEEVSKADVVFKNGGATVQTLSGIHQTENYNLIAAPAAAEGKQFTGWRSSVDNELYDAEATGFTMSTPAAEVVYTAEWLTVVPTPTAEVITTADLTNGEWVLVTDANQLRSGDVVIIATADNSSTYNMAMGAQGSENYRGNIGITKSADKTKLIPVDGVAKLFLQNGYDEGQFGLHDLNNSENGYLYYSGSGNTLNSKQATITKSASWAITITDGIATIKCAGGNGDRYIKYNASSPRFSCYAGSQQDVALYKWVKKISGNMDISDVTLTDAVIVGNSATLNIDANKTLHDVTIQSTSGAMGVDGTSGQLTGSGTLTINGNLFLEIQLRSDAMDAEASQKWYCISAPFDVDINNGFYWGNGTHMVHNVDFQIFEWDGDRRATGASGWRRTGGTMKAGIAYFIGFDDARDNQNTIKLKAKNNTISNVGVINAPAHSGSAEAATYGNWNGLGNPNFHHIALNMSVQAFDYNEQSYNPYTTGDYNFVVGTPFFIQYAGNIGIEAADNANYRAPKREGENYSYCVRIGRADASHADNQIFVRASETASAEFDDERNMITMNGTTSNYGALLWTKNYGDKRLAIEEAPLVNNKASYELGIFAPTAGTYSISVAAPQENAELYLTKNGHIIWNLTMSPCELELTQGQNDEYGLMLRANVPSVSTDVEGIQPSADSIQKVIIDEKVFILRGGQLYGIDGKTVR